MVARALPVNLTGTVLKPVRQCHVAVRQINGIRSSRLRCNRILLGEDKAHYLAKLDILQEELDVYGICLVIVVRISFLFDEIFLRNHFDVGVISIDRNRTAEGDSHGSVSCEKGPPYSLPESFVLPAELRTFHTMSDWSAKKSYQ